MVDTGKYTESEATILHHFFTNTGDTYFLKNFPDPEVAALFVASYSRNKKTLLDMFLDTLIDLDIIEPHNKPIKKQIKDLKKQDSTSDIEAKIKELNLNFRPSLNKCFLNRLSWVSFPVPSTPSKTKSFPLFF